MSNLNTIDDPDKIEQIHKLSTAVNQMPEEITDRFKAMKVLYDECLEIDEEQQAEYRKVELMFEKLYEDVYR